MLLRASVGAVAAVALAYFTSLCLSGAPVGITAPGTEVTDSVVDAFLDFATSVTYPLRDLAGPRGRALRAAFRHVQSSPSYGIGSSTRSSSDDGWAVAACNALETPDLSTCARLLLGSSDRLRAQRTARLLAFLRRLRSSLPTARALLHARPHRVSSAPAGTSRAATSVVVVGGGPAGLISGLAAIQAGCDVLLLERRTTYARSVWFDLSAEEDGLGDRSSGDWRDSSVGEGLGGVGPTQALLESLGFGHHRALVQRQGVLANGASRGLAERGSVDGPDRGTGRRKASNGDDGALFNRGFDDGASDDGDDEGGDGDGRARAAARPEVVTVLCAELESFLAKVLFLAGATLEFGVEGLGPCLAAAPPSTAGSSSSSSSSRRRDEHWATVAVAPRGGERWTARGDGSDHGDPAPADGAPELVSAGFLPAAFLLAARTPCEVLRAAREARGPTPWRADHEKGEGEASGVSKSAASGGYEVFTAAPFSVLVGADGAKSKVRASINGSWDSVTAFQVPLRQRSGRRLEVHVGPALCFPTVILRFAPDAATGRCPRLRGEARAGSASVFSSDPFAVRAAVPEVTSAFKRFFHGHCELQVALTAAAAAALFAAEEGFSAGVEANAEALAGGSSCTPSAAEAAWPVPWLLLLRVCHFLFEAPFADAPSLRRCLVRCGAADQAGGGGASDACGAAVHLMPLRRAGPAAVVSLAHGGVGGGGGEAAAVAVLVGDSAATALYRLGVGVNSIFAGFADLRRAFAAGRLAAGTAAGTAAGATSGRSGGGLASAWQQRFAPAHAARLWRVSNAQAAAAFWESRCGLVVYRDELWRPAVESAAGADGDDHYEGPLEPVTALKSCTNASGLPPWSWLIL